MKIEAPEMLQFVNKTLLRFWQKEWMKWINVKDEVAKIEAKTSTLSRGHRNWLQTKAYQMYLIAFIEWYQNTLSFRFQEAAQFLGGIPGKMIEVVKGKRRGSV